MSISVVSQTDPQSSRSGASSQWAGFDIEDLHQLRAAIPSYHHTISNIESYTLVLYISL